MPQLKPRSDIHLTRKVWHFIGISFIVFCYHKLDPKMSIQVLTFISTLMILTDILRQRSEVLNKIFISSFHSVMRDSERNGLAGSTFLMLGTLIIVLLFPPKVVTLSLLFLATADPIASYFGIRYGKDKLFGRKSLQGTLAGFVTCMIVAMIFYVSNNLMTDRLLIVSILSGLAGAFAEAFPVGKLDDNLVMPVMSSIFLWAIFFLFGGF